jgi:hypothetical protein
MARLAVINAVEERLAALWDKCPVVGVIRKDKRMDESASSLVVQYLATGTERPTVSDRYYVEEGGIRFVLLMNRSEDPALMMQWADELADLFRDKSFDGVRCRRPTSPFIDDSNDEGNFYSLSIVAPYEFHFRDEESQP